MSVRETRGVPTEIEAALDRIERSQAKLNAFLTATGEEALREARVVEQERAGGVTRGPMHGVPFGIKDLIATQGIRTTAGSKILGRWIPTRDAAVVWTLRTAGGIAVGKTNTHEFAFGTTNDNPHYGAAHNPWNPALTTGGSSGGSAAAVAAGVVPVALGTDTAGSIRIPSALCGAVGLKPTYNLISTRGVVPLSPTLDTVGPIGRTVEDVERLMAGFGFVTRAPFSWERITIGVPESYVFDHVDPEVERIVREALRALQAAGAEVRVIALPQLKSCWEVGISIVRPEALEFHSRWYPRRAAEYGEDVARSLEAAKEISGKEYVAGRRARRTITATLRRALGDVDLLAGPTVPILAFPNADAYRPVLPGGELPRHALTRLTYPFSLSRLPAISVPCGLSASRLPVALQLAAGPRQEALLLAAARAFEDVRGSWPAPPVFFG